MKSFPHATMDPLIGPRVTLRPMLASDGTDLVRAPGIVIQGRNLLYQIAPQFLADKTERLIDFGYCLLRLNVLA